MRTNHYLLCEIVHSPQFRHCLMLFRKTMLYDEVNTVVLKKFCPQIFMEWTDYLLQQYNKNIIHQYGWECNIAGHCTCGLYFHLPMVIKYDTSTHASSCHIALISHHNYCIILLFFFNCLFLTIIP